MHSFSDFTTLFFFLQPPVDVEGVCQLYRAYFLPYRWYISENLVFKTERVLIAKYKNGG